MKRGGAMPMNRPTGWVYLRPGNCTIRWRRGDDVAYVFSGKQMETYPDEPLDEPLRVEILATIAVSPQGWTDLAEVRRVGRRWLRSRAA
ncbi:MAG: hypothetical protein ACRDTE_24965 [Pseudonocardiaceae bacterium]